ncbi:hypothetical protein OH77DRAFT_1523907 [Trametes cingulata]|nr:hypothetical protein OH77DRAFT_1523907 [Trametes cingulata]
MLVGFALPTYQSTPSLLSLNYDVLQEIISYLHAKDALNLALCCKALHELASPRISAIAHIWRPSHFRKVCAHMLGPRLPVKHLRELDIHYTAFADEGEEDESEEDEDEDEDEEGEGEGVDSENEEPDPLDVFWDFSQAHLVRDLLLQATALRRLALDRVHPLLEKEPRIGEALCAMTRLVSLDLCTVSEPTIPLISNLNRNLRRLQVAYHGFDDIMEDQPNSMPLCLSLLAPFQQLQTLILQHFDPLPEVVANPPQFPALRTLRLQYVTSAALPFVDLCPNISKFDLYMDADKPHSHRFRMPEDGRKWGSLTHLGLAALRDVHPIQNRLKIIDRVQIAGRPLQQPERPITSYDHAKIATFFDLLCVTSPVSLALSVAVGWTPVTFWEEVPTLAPRLRILSVRIELMSLSEQNESWLDTVPDALRALPLLYLHIDLPKTKSVRKLFPPALNPETSAEEIRQQYAAAARIE